MKIYDNYMAVVERIEKLCASEKVDSKLVTLLPISKTASADEMMTLINNGVTIFGESRVQDALKKIDTIKLSTDKKIELQFIGRIQQNKLKRIIEEFSLIHSVSDLKTVEAINEISQQLAIKKPILIQLNLAKEEQKAGVYGGELDEVVEYARNCDNLLLSGFMLIPPFENDPKDNVKYFRKAKTIFDNFAKLNRNIKILSMGMSGDFEVALKEGATLLRVGSVIFR